MKIKDAKNIKTLFCLFEQECDKMIKVTAPVRIDISAGWSDADPFRGQFGGAVLNAAITLRVSGILDNNKLTTSLEKVPAASGLGTSGALRTAYLVIANPSLIENKMELVKRVNTFENAIVGQRAGFQDQCAAIFGGVNYWDFYKDHSRFFNVKFVFDYSFKLFVCFGFIIHARYQDLADFVSFQHFHQPEHMILLRMREY